MTRDDLAFGESAEQDEFGADFGGSRRAKRKARRKARRKKILRTVKKVGKPVAKVLKSPVVKNIIGAIPVVGPAARTSIEVGEAVAGQVRKSLHHVSDVEDELREAIKNKAPASKIKALRAKGNRAAKGAEKELRRFGRIKKAEAALVRKVAGKARKGDKKARAVLGVLKARKAGDPAKVRLAERAARAAGVVSIGDPSEAAAAKVDQGDAANAIVVTMASGRKYSFDRRSFRG